MEAAITQAQFDAGFRLIDGKVCLLRLRVSPFYTIGSVTTGTRVDFTMELPEDAELTRFLVFITMDSTPEDQKWKVRFGYYSRSNARCQKKLFRFVAVGPGGAPSPVGAPVPAVGRWEALEAVTGITPPDLRVYVLD